MNTNHDFIPRRTIDAINYGALVHQTISAPDYDPTTIGLTDLDVSELGDLVSANQSVLADIHSLKAALQAKTKLLSGPNGTHRRMVAKLRSIGSKARSSAAPNQQLAGLGMTRKTTNPSRRTITTVAPSFSVVAMSHGNVRVAFRVSDSNSPRARAEHATSLQIAVVDAANPAAEGEADNAPIKTVTRSPAQLDTTGWPAKVRLYARWISRRGETSAWSSPQSFTRP
jgi:hypothetical protein